MSTDMTAYDEPDAADADPADLPGELFDALESVLGQPLLRADVLDMGTGATRVLRGRGARVLALDPEPRPLARLHARSPAIPVARARAAALPVRSGSIDLVCLPRAWQPADAGAVVPEALRVLRPRGVIATWCTLPEPHDGPEPSPTAFAAHGLVVAHVRLPWQAGVGQRWVTHLVAGTRTAGARP